eukprot:jgi/Ulvmu1/12276/UM087_0010.1
MPAYHACLTSMHSSLVRTKFSPRRKAVGLSTRPRDQRRNRSALALAQQDGASSRYSSGTFTPPQKLHSTEVFRQRCRQGEKSDRSTVYTVRLETATDRGAGMDDLHSGVMICLLGKTEAVMHRICQISDTTSTDDVMDDVCQLVGPDAGAACDRDTKHGSSSASGTTDVAPKYVQRRFQSGGLDEVFFPGPDVGQLEAVLVGPECGAWKLSEVVVSNSRQALTQHFVCRQHLGTKGGRGAALLPAVPPGAVVYGSGDTAVLLSAGEAEAMRDSSMAQYGALKQRIFNFTSVLVAAGLAVTAATGGPEAAEAFALGGCMAFVYQLALNGSVDKLALDAPSGAAAVPTPDLGLRGGGGSGGAAGSGFGMQLAAGGLKRYATVTATLFAAIVATQLWDDRSGTDAEVHQLTIIVTAMLGFASYKVAVIAAALTPSPARRSVARSKSAKQM